MGNRSSTVGGIASKMDPLLEVEGLALVCGPTEPAGLVRGVVASDDVTGDKVTSLFLSG